MWPALIAAAPYIASAIGGIAGAMGSRGKKSSVRTNQSLNQAQTTNRYVTPANPIHGVYYNLGPQILHSLGNAMQPWTGSAEYPGGYVGPTSATRNAWEQGNQTIPYYNQAAGLASDAVPGMQGILGTAGGNYGFLSNAADVANNPYVQAQLTANASNVKQLLLEQILPAIQGQAVGGSAVGSSRHGIAQAQGIERAAEQLSRANAFTMLNAYGQGLNAQQMALGYTGNMLQNQLAPAGAMGMAGQYGNMAMDIGRRVGESQEQYQQRQLDQQRYMHEFQQMEPWQRMLLTQQIMGAYAPYAGTQTNQNMSENQASNSTASGGGQNPWGSAIGGALAGWRLGSAIGGGR